MKGGAVGFGNHSSSNFINVFGLGRKNPRRCRECRAAAETFSQEIGGGRKSRVAIRRFICFLNLQKSIVHSAAPLKKDRGKGAVGNDARITNPLVIIHQKHMVGKILPKSSRFQSGFALGLLLLSILISIHFSSSSSDTSQFFIIKPFRRKCKPFATGGKMEKGAFLFRRGPPPMAGFSFLPKSVSKIAR